MRIRGLTLMIAVACGVMLFVGLVFGQGSLTPSGAPAPTMKTLQEIEPRIAITSVPYTVTQPGSYYFTTNLSSTGHGVIIQSDRVTLDLMGFALTGDRGSADYGVWLQGATNAPLRDVVVRNGAISTFGHGVWCVRSTNCRFEHLSASSNYYYGVYLYGYNGQCNGNTVVNCALTGNDGSGVYLYGYNGQCDGNTVVNCALTGNGGSGVFLDGYNGQCDGNTIVDCAVTGNGSSGVWLNGTSGQCDGNTVAHCAISKNDVRGITLDGWSGQCDGNTVAHCTISKNGSSGIYLYYADGNRIEGNHVSGQTGVSTYGILTSSTAQNLILRNSCVGQTNNYSISVNDTYGPIVTNTGALPSSGDAAHPWANFSR